MAILYVRSTDGNNADNGSTWALAKATLAGAFSAAAAGDIIYVSDNHAETQASAMTLTSPGTAASPCYVICVDDSAEPPTALATTGTITTTGSNNITHAGYVYYYGITLSAGTGTGTNVRQSWSASIQIFRNCTLTCGSSGTGSIFVIGATTASTAVILYNSNISFASTGGGIRPVGTFLWYGGTLSTAPTSLIVPVTGVGTIGSVIIDGCDLNTIGSGKYIADVSVSTQTKVYVRNTKLGSSGGMTTGTIPIQHGMEFEVINTDSADTNYFDYYQNYAGFITQETTIVRTGGASDGTTSHSREMTSSANASKFYPLILPRFTNELAVWNETVGSSITLTVHIITDNITLTDKECWLEVEYLGTSASTLSLFSNDADSITDLLLGGSASNQTTSTETWTTTGLTTPVKQQLSVSVTPQKKGPVRCKVVLAKPSTTVYVCPKLVIS